MNTLCLNFKLILLIQVVVGLITNCTTEVDSVCSKCNDGFVLSNNQCYAKVTNCDKQTNDQCT